MGFWTVLFRAHNPPASFIFHHRRLSEIVSNADYCAQHLSGWESVSWWIALLQFWRSLKEMEIGLNSPQRYLYTSVWKGVNRWGRYANKSANEGKSENTSPFSDSLQHSPMLTALLCRILKIPKMCLIVMLTYLLLCFVALIIDTDQCCRYAALWMRKSVWQSMWLDFWFNSLLLAACESQKCCMQQCEAFFWVAPSQIR